MQVIEYSLYAERLSIGERVKGGVYRPSAKTIPYSQVRGAVENRLGLKIHGVGVMDNISGIGHITIGPKDRGRDTVRLPIKVMYLERVKGRVFIINENNISDKLEENLVLYMGGLRMRGFGKCELSNKEVFKVGIEDFDEGELNTRIPVDLANFFGITLIKEKLGYLFVPENEETGWYALSYFEGSKVRGPKFLLKGGDGYAR